LDDTVDVDVVGVQAAQSFARALEEHQDLRAGNTPAQASQSQR